MTDHKMTRDEFMRLAEDAPVGEVRWHGPDRVVKTSSGCIRNNPQEPDKSIPERPVNWSWLRPAPANRKENPDGNA